MVLWSLLGLYTLISDFDVGTGVKIAMCVIAIYVVASDGAIRLLRSFKA
jgi:phosphatidylcholine synthase